MTMPSENEIPLTMVTDCTTGETTIRPMNDDELTFHKQFCDESKQNAITKETEQAKKQQALDSAHAKLTALGLTPEEISAITGIN